MKNIFENNQKKENRKDWVLQWPGQIIIAGCQTYWTKMVTDAVNDNQLKALYQSLLNQVSNAEYDYRIRKKSLANVVLYSEIAVRRFGTTRSRPFDKIATLDIVGCNCN